MRAMSAKVWPGATTELEDVSRVRVVRRLVMSLSEPVRRKEGEESSAVEALLR